MAKGNDTVKNTVSKYPDSRKRGLLPPWKPGDSGNPGGRPRRKPISDRYEAIAEILLPEKDRKRMKLPRGATYADAAAFQQFLAALDGDTTAMREIREAIEGKATIRVADEDAPDERHEFVLTLPKVRQLA
jgi:hypothetical protein